MEFSAGIKAILFQFQTFVAETFEPFSFPSSDENFLPIEKYHRWLRNFIRQFYVVNDYGSNHFACEDLVMVVKMDVVISWVYERDKYFL